MDCNLKTYLLASALLSASYFVYPSEFAYAQTNDQDTPVDLSVIDTSNSLDAITITSDELEAFNTINLEQYLNTLPPVIPGFDATSNNPGNGSATIDLHGLGPERTLVLVNGNRFGPQNLGKTESEPTSFFDLNVIPAALVKRIDIKSGGQSSIFGTGAVSGIVNIELNDEFEGSQLRASTEITDNGDGAKTSISGLFGQNFRAGKGNITLFADYTKRDGVFASAREFSSVVNDDQGTGFEAFGSSAVPGTRLFFGGYDFSLAGFSSNGVACTGPNGLVTEGLRANCRGSATFDANGDIVPWINNGPNTSRYNYASAQLLQLPQERFNVSAFGRYNFNEFVNLKLRGLFTSNKVPRELAPTPFFSTVTIDLANNPFLTPTARSVLLESSGGNSLYSEFIGRRMVEVGPQIIENDSETIHLAAEMSGQWDRNWSYDVQGHFAKNTGDERQLNLVSVDAVQDVVLNNRCNIFGEGSLSQQCVDEIRINALTDIEAQQIGFVGQIKGRLPAIMSPYADNPLHINLGIEYRNEQASIVPPVLSRGSVSTLFQNTSTEGEIGEYSAFGQFNLPVLENKSLAKNLSLNGAYRITDHSIVGKMESYRIGGIWEPVSNIGFEVNYDRSARAPDIRQLFMSGNNVFSNLIDPCSFSSFNDPLGIREICLLTGVPEQLYGTSYDTQFGFAEVGGNKGLRPELADTFTASLSFKSKTIDGLNILLRYSDIKISDGIGQPDSRDILLSCFFGGVLENCDLVNRRPFGQLRSVDARLKNFKSIGSEHVNVSIEYPFTFEKTALFSNQSSFKFQFDGRYTLTRQVQNRNEYRTEFDCSFSSSGACSVIGSRVVASDPTNNCAGFHRAQVDVCDEPIPFWKHSARLNYRDGPLGLNLRWRFIGNTRNDDFIAIPDERPGISPLFVSKTGTQNFFDLTGSWQVNDQIELSGGVLNLLDNDPPILGDCCSEQSNTFPATYDPLGRKFFVGAKARF